MRAAAPEAVRAGPRSVRAQVLRGVGYTAVLLGGLWLAGVLVRAPRHALTDSNAIHPQWWSISVVAAVVVGAWWLRRRVRAWPSHPRWLLPTAAAFLALASIVALKSFSTTVDLDRYSCRPLVDAWRPVVDKPSAADMAAYRGYYMEPLPSRSVLLDPVKRKQYVQRRELVRDSPAFRRVDRYEIWVMDSGNCPPRSRRYLVLSGCIMLLGVGGAFVAATGSRRRPRRHAISDGVPASTDV